MKLTLDKFFEHINNPLYLKYKQDLIVESIDVYREMINYKYKNALNKEGLI